MKLIWKNTLSWFVYMVLFGLNAYFLAVVGQGRVAVLSIIDWVVCGIYLLLFLMSVLLHLANYLAKKDKEERMRQAATLTFTPHNRPKTDEPKKEENTNSEKDKKEE